MLLLLYDSGLSFQHTQSARLELKRDPRDREIAPLVLRHAAPMLTGVFPPLCRLQQTLRGGAQATPEARRQPPMALTPEETWRPTGVPLPSETPGARSAEVSPSGKAGPGSPSRPSPKRRRKAAAPAQRQLTLLELSERANSPGKTTRSVKIALMHAERKVAGKKAKDVKLAGEATLHMGARLRAPTVRPSANPARLSSPESSAAPPAPERYAPTAYSPVPAPSALCCARRSRALTLSIRRAAQAASKQTFASRTRSTGGGCSR